MSEYRKKKKYRIKPRFYFFLAILIAVCIWAGYGLVKFFEPPVVEWGRLSNDVEANAVIIRDEMVVNSDNYGRLECQVAEGEYVELNTEVAQIYESGFSEDDINNLIDIRQQIKDYQTSNILKNIIHDDLIRIDTEIDALIDEISELVRTGDTRQLPAKERQMSLLMEQRRSTMNEILQSDSSLETLYQQEQVLINKIDSTKVTLLTPKAGLISFFIDGMEGMLNFKLVEHMSAGDFELIYSQIEDTFSKSGLGSSSVVNMNQPIYRIVNEGKWYAAMLISRNENTLQSGANCQVSFEGYGEEMLDATVYAVRDAGRDVLVILEFRQSVAPVVTLRTAVCHIGAAGQGFKVPLRTLVNIDGVQGVHVKDEQGQTFIPVNVIDYDSYYALVTEASDATKSLIIDQRLVVP